MLLEFLVEKRGTVVSAEAIAGAIWGDSSRSQADVKQYIFRLRRKIEAEPGNPRLITTVRGFGYTYDGVL